MSTLNCPTVHFRSEWLVIDVRDQVHIHYNFKHFWMCLTEVTFTIFWYCNLKVVFEPAVKPRMRPPLLRLGFLVFFYNF